jgi:hypothetical protein
MEFSSVGRALTFKIFFLSGARGLVYYTTLTKPALTFKNFFLSGGALSA